MHRPLAALGSGRTAVRAISSIRLLKSWAMLFPDAHHPVCVLMRSSPSNELAAHAVHGGTWSRWAADLFFLKRSASDSASATHRSTQPSSFCVGIVWGAARNSRMPVGAASRKRRAADPKRPLGQRNRVRSCSIFCIVATGATDPAEPRSVASDREN